MATLREREYATETLFNLNHNLEDYRRVVGEKYQNAPALEAYPTAEKFGYEMPTLESYDTPASVHTTYAPVLETYAAPTRNVNNQVSVDLETYAAPTRAQTTYAPTFEGYVAPRPSASFAPAQPSFETYAQPTRNNPMIGVELGTYNQPMSRKNAIVAEVRPDWGKIERQELENSIEYEVSRQSEEDEAVGFQPIRLNAVGMVAIVSFLCVAVMVIAFIVANAITISGNAAAISGLSTSNASIAQSVAAAQAGNAELYANYEAYLAEQGFLPADMTLEDYLLSTGEYSYVAAEAMPVVAAWTPKGNPDASTNIFDAICKFLNSIF